MLHNLEIITQWLDNLISQSDKNVALSTLMSTINQLKEIFPLENQECDSLVEIVQQRLQALLDNSNTQRIRIQTVTLPLYTQENGRTKTVTFMIDSTNRQSIKILSGEILDSKEDYQSREKINTEIQELRRQNILKQAKSHQDAQKVFIS